MLNFLIESISSPHNSILTPVFWSSEISIIPPLTLNSPFPSIKSYLTYPKFISFSLISSKLQISPTFRLIMFFSSVFFDGNFCIRLSIVVTTIKSFLSIILFIASILSKGKSLLSASKSYVTISFLGKNTTFSLSRLCKFSYIFLACISLYVTTNIGFLLYKLIPSIICISPTSVKPDTDTGPFLFSISLLKSTNFFVFPNSPIIVFI